MRLQPGARMMQAGVEIHDLVARSDGGSVEPPPRSDPAATRPRRSHTLRAELGWLLVAVLLPLIIAGVAFLVEQWKQQREAAVARLQEHARTLQRAVDRELSLDLAVLRALAASREIDRGDWRAFHALAREAAEARPGSWFALYEPGGQNVVNTRVPFGTPLPNLRELRSSHTDADWQGRKIPLLDLGFLFGPLESRTPTFSGLVYGVVTGRPAVGSVVPVMRNGKATHVLALVYSSRFFETVLQAETVQEVTTAMFDDRGVFIARNRDSESFVGLPGPEPFRNGVARLPPEGVGEAMNVESIPFVYAYSRSAVADYVVGAGIAKAAVLAPAWRALWSWLGVLVCAGAVGAVFAFRLWRRVGTPLAALAHQARSLGETHVDVAPTRIDEVEALRAALQEAARNERIRRDAERALQEAEQQYRTLAENAPEAIARFDRRLRHGYLNEYGATLYGVPARDAIGKTSAELGMPADRAELWDRHLDEVFATGRQVTVDFELDSPAIGPRFFSSLLVPEMDEAGAVTSIVAITRDVTESKRAQEALRDANERLRDANERLRDADRRKDEFLGMLSHELRNPLAPIRSSVHVLHHAEPGSERARRALTIIGRQSAHLTRIVDDLLDVTRIVRGKILLHRDRVDLREIVSRAAEDAHQAIEQRGATVRVTLPESRVWADVDATRIAQVLGNLLNNAIKFTHPGDEIAVTLRAIDATARIAVRDTGAGIDPDLLPTIFEAFVQGKRTLARSEGGVGLGLALVKGLVELHGGAVMAYSQGVGKGAEFVLTLPLVGPIDDAHVAKPPDEEIKRLLDSS